MSLKRRAVCTGPGSLGSAKQQRVASTSGQGATKEEAFDTAKNEECKSFNSGLVLSQGATKEEAFDTAKNEECESLNSGLSLSQGATKEEAFDTAKNEECESLNSGLSLSQGATKEEAFDTVKNEQCSFTSGLVLSQGTTKEEAFDTVKNEERESFMQADACPDIPTACVNSEPAWDDSVKEELADDQSLGDAARAVEPEKVRKKDLKAADIIERIKSGYFETLADKMLHKVGIQDSEWARMHPRRDVMMRA